MQKSVFQDNCMLPTIYWDNFLKKVGDVGFGPTQCTQMSPAYEAVVLPLN